MADTERGLLLADCLVGHANTPGSRCDLREHTIKYKYTITWCLRLLLLAMAALHIYTDAHTSPQESEVLYGPLASRLQPVTLAHVAVITDSLRWITLFLCLEVFGWYTPRTRLYAVSWSALLSAIVMSSLFALASYVESDSISQGADFSPEAAEALVTTLTSHAGPTAVAIVKFAELGWPGARVVLGVPFLIYLCWICYYGFIIKMSMYDGILSK